MACGTPMVVSDITGFRELVGGGAEAVLVPKDRPAAWARTIRRTDGRLRRRSHHGRAPGGRKAEGYAWPLVAEQVMRVYRRVLQ